MKAAIIASKKKYLSFKEVCDELSISLATGKNWIKLEKIYPDKVINNNYLFTQANIQNIKKSIKNGKNSSLKSRRNKTFVSGNSIYKSYISEKSQNIIRIQSILNIIEKQNILLTDQKIMLLIAECAIQLFTQRKHQKKPDANLLYKFLSKKLELENFEQFIAPFIRNKSESLKFIEKNPELFSIKYNYEFGEDILGLLYLSTKNIGNRKATGAYYTPTKIVKQLIKNICNDCKNIEEKKLLDPCCGTGNFLLQLPEKFALENIYANDIDPISAQITKINLALHFKNFNYTVLDEHVSAKDYLHLKLNGGMDFIIGNPPWGYKFSEKEQQFLKNNFKTAQGKNIESYDVIIEQSLNHLNNDGILSFVLPESILNVKTHKTVRELLIQSNNLQYLEYLGNSFDGVQCPAIILQVKHNMKKMSCKGLKVKDNKKTFTIKHSREISADYFAFKTNDKEYSLLHKLLNHKDSTTLYGQAIFALGIVTGNNLEFISYKKQKNTEIILKGSDILKYAIKNTNNFISFKPERFQQVAPVEYYRAKEKLLYRFICNQLVFAYDNNQTLSLNSCNILIPQIAGMDIKYIMAILNSRIAQFIYTKQYNSVKILRSHIEQIPIPKVDKKTQNKIIDLVNNLIIESSHKKREQLYSKIEDILFEIFELTNTEQEIILNETAVSNNFLN